MINPPSFDPVLEYQEIMYNGRLHVCLSGSALKRLIDSPVFRVLANCPPMPENLWLTGASTVAIPPPKLSAIPENVAKYGDSAP